MRATARFLGWTLLAVVCVVEALHEWFHLFP